MESTTRRRHSGSRKVCVVGASGKLGRHVVEQALGRGYDVVGGVPGAERRQARRPRRAITVVPGDTDDPAAIARAVAGCDAVLTVLVPWGMHHYASGTAQAVLDARPAGARLVFSCGWHITRDGQDVYSRRLRMFVAVFGASGRLARKSSTSRTRWRRAAAIFASDTRWTVVRGSDLEEGESQGLPVWSTHVGDPVLASNRTRRVDFALFMLRRWTTTAWSSKPRHRGPRSPRPRSRTPRRRGGRSMSALPDSGASG